MPISTFDFMRGEHSADNEVRAVVYWCKTNADKVRVSSEHTNYIWLNIGKAMEKVENKGVKADLLAYQRIREKLS